MADVTVIVPVRNDAAGLARCLRSIQGDAGTRDLELIVGDNGSVDGTQQVAADLGAHVVGLGGLRVGAVRNRAAAEATASHLLFVDADHEVGPGWMHAALGALTLADVGAAGAPYQSPLNPTWVQRIYGAMRRAPMRLEDTAWLGAGNLAVRRDAFERVGGFDESLEACEDVDFCARVRQAGWRVVAVPGMTSVHHGDPPTLRALFRGERWRGRDNLRVSLRGPLTVRDVPSIAIPIGDLIAMAAVAAGLLLPGWRILAALGAATFVGLSLIRAAALTRRLGTFDLPTLTGAFAVAVTYDAARALALVSRAAHRRAIR
jgi:hypothetical protein